MLNTRDEDISVALHVFEERALYFMDSQDIERAIDSGEVRKFDGPLKWEIISDYESSETGKMFSVDKRKVKKYFLSAWLEIRLWDNGSHIEQKICPAPVSLESIGLSSDKAGQFFYGECIQLSIDAMRKYWDSYLRLKPKKRQDRPRFISKKQSVAKGTAWHVFVTPDLRACYYDETKSIQNQHSDEFFPLQEKMITINCPKKTETGHAAIANYDSWQAFLHALNKKADSEREIKMDSENTLLGKILQRLPRFLNQKTDPGKGIKMDSENTVLWKIRKFQKQAASDQTPVSDEIKGILRRIAKGTRLSELDKDKVQEASELSPKIRFLLGMAQRRFIRSEIAEHLAREHRENENIKVADILKSENILTHLKKWISPTWQPE